MTRYVTVDHNGKHAIQNSSDNSLLKSKESGNIIAFSEKQKAEQVCIFFQSQYDAIVDAGKMWLLKTKAKGSKSWIRID